MRGSLIGGRMKNRLRGKCLGKEAEKGGKPFFCGRFREAEEIVVRDGAVLPFEVELSDGDVFTAQRFA